MLDHFCFCWWGIEFFKVTHWWSFLVSYWLLETLYFNSFNATLMRSFPWKILLIVFNTWSCSYFSICEVSHWFRKWKFSFSMRCIVLLAIMDRCSKHCVWFTLMECRHASLLYAIWVVFIVWCIFNDLNYCISLFGYIILLYWYDYLWAHHLLRYLLWLSNLLLSFLIWIRKLGSRLRLNLIFFFLW
jgi:hypothetical protein